MTSTSITRTEATVRPGFVPSSSARTIQNVVNSIFTYYDTQTKEWMSPRMIKSMVDRARESGDSDFLRKTHERIRKHLRRVANVYLTELPKAVPVQQVYSTGALKSLIAAALQEVDAPPGVKKPTLTLVTDKIRMWPLLPNDALGVAKSKTFAILGMDKQEFIESYAITQMISTSRGIEAELRIPDFLAERTVVPHYNPTYRTEGADAEFLSRGLGIIAHMVKTSPTPGEHPLASVLDELYHMFVGVNNTHVMGSGSPKGAIGRMLRSVQFHAESLKTQKLEKTDYYARALTNVCPVAMEYLNPNKEERDSRRVLFNIRGRRTDNLETYLRQVFAMGDDGIQSLFPLNLSANSGPVFGGAPIGKVLYSVKVVRDYLEMELTAAATRLPNRANGLHIQPDRLEAFRAAYKMPKAEVYPKEKIETRSRNIAVPTASVNLLFQPIFWLMNKIFPSFLEDRNSKHLSHFSPFNGGVGKLVSRMVEECDRSLSRMCAVAYADNLYVMQHTKSGQYYLFSLDGNQFESSFTDAKAAIYARFLDIIFGLSSEAPNPAGGGNVGMDMWWVALHEVMPLVALHYVSILGNMQIQENELASGFAGTFWINNMGMLLAIIKWQNYWVDLKSPINTPPPFLLTPAPKRADGQMEVPDAWWFTRAANQIFSEAGISMKIDNVVEINVEDGLPVDKFYRADILGFDALYVTVQGVRLVLPVLAYKRLLNGICFNKTSYFHPHMPAELGNTARFVTVKTLYLFGGFAYPQLSVFLLIMMQQFLMHITHISGDAVSQVVSVLLETLNVREDGFSTTDFINTITTTSMPLMYDVIRVGAGLEPAQAVAAQFVAQDKRYKAKGKKPPHGLAALIPLPIIRELWGEPVEDELSAWGAPPMSADNPTLTAALRSAGALVPASILSAAHFDEATGGTQKSHRMVSVDTVVSVVESARARWDGMSKELRSRAITGVKQLFNEIIKIEEKDSRRRVTSTEPVILFIKKRAEGAPLVSLQFMLASMAGQPYVAVSSVFNSSAFSGKLLPHPIGDPQDIADTFQVIVRAIIATGQPHASAYSRPLSAAPRAVIAEVKEALASVEQDEHEAIALADTWLDDEESGQDVEEEEVKVASRQPVKKARKTAIPPPAEAAEAQENSDEEIDRLFDGLAEAPPVRTEGDA